MLRSLHSALSSFTLRAFSSVAVGPSMMTMRKIGHFSLNVSEIKLCPYWSIDLRWRSEEGRVVWHCLAPIALWGKQR